MLCGKNTKTMARFSSDVGGKYLCSFCRSNVHKCMVKWAQLIEQDDDKSLPADYDWRKDYYGTHT